LLRELSAVFFIGYMILLLVLVMNVHDGPLAFASYVNTLRSPGIIVFNVLALLFALLHTVTWFNAMPTALPMRRGIGSVPAIFIIGPAYLLLLAVSAVILVLMLV
jgi:fumarate reductase subunit C